MLLAQEDLQPIVQKYNTIKELSFISTILLYILNIEINKILTRIFIIFIKNCQILKVVQFELAAWLLFVSFVIYVPTTFMYFKFHLNIDFHRLVAKALNSFCNNLQIRLPPSSQPRLVGNAGDCPTDNIPRVYFPRVCSNMENSFPRHFPARALLIAFRCAPALFHWVVVLSVCTCMLLSISLQ